MKRPEPQQTLGLRLVAEKGLDAYIHSFSGAENESRDIYPNQTFPYIGRLNQEVAETDDFLTVLVSRDTR